MWSKTYRHIQSPLTSQYWVSLSFILRNRNRKQYREGKVGEVDVGGDAGEGVVEGRGCRRGDVGGRGDRGDSIDLRLVM